MRTRIGPVAPQASACERSLGLRGQRSAQLARVGKDRVDAIADRS